MPTRGHGCPKPRHQRCTSVEYVTDARAAEEEDEAECEGNIYNAAPKPGQAVHAERQGLSAQVLEES